jgi:hypothetical protein
MFTDGDIFITNVTSTYQDIPKDCNLVGAEFDKDYPANSSRLHITDDGPFWIGATSCTILVILFRPVAFYFSQNFKLFGFPIFQF